jgi:hypothetical protein
MTVFDVYVNGRKLCRAGVGKDGVLDAIVSWVKLTGAAARTARRLRSPGEETRLQVGGLAKGTHRRWTDRSLKTGDRVAIDVVAAERFDRPVREEPRHRKVMDDNTTFLNVDLDIWSSSPLEPLVKAFGRKVVVLHVGKEGRRHGAHLELAASGDRDNADQLIRSFVTLVKKLPRSSRTLWNRAQVREFNVGIQAATKPFNYDLRLQQKTLQAMASVNARLGITVYGAMSSAASPNPPSV